MELAWCCKCQADVSLAHAVAELPCPQCGAVSYFLMAGDGEREALLSESERMMRLGHWPAAEKALNECAARGLISAADFTLSSANLEWRKCCAASAASLVAGDGVPLAAFRAVLVSGYDEYVVDWLLREFRGLRLVPEGGSYLVEARTE